MPVTFGLFIVRRAAMFSDAQRLNHTLICIGAFISWYSLMFLVAMLPAYGALYRSGLAIPVIFGLFQLPFALILWRHYHRHYGTLPPGKVTLTGLALPAAAFTFITLIYSLFEAPEPWLETLNQLSGIHLVLTVVSICLLAPVSEEVIFRGFLLNAGLGFGKRGEQIAILATSLIFMLVHTQYQQPATFVILFLFSVILCYARLYTRSLLVPIILHAICNTFTLAVLLS